MHSDLITSARCLSCGRRHHQYHMPGIAAPLLLLGWALRHAVSARRAPAPCPVLLHGYPDAEERPGPAPAVPGRRDSLVLASIGAAPATASGMEAACNA